MNSKYILILIFCCFTFSSIAYQKNYSIKNGFPSNNVYSIKQDKRGFIWASTDKGLVKYDGKNFKLFTIENGLASNDNFAMLIDSKDFVWLYSFVGISRIDPDGGCKIFGNTKSYFSHFIINNKDEIFYSVIDYKRKINDKNAVKYFRISNSVVEPIVVPNCQNLLALAILHKDQYLIFCRSNDRKYTNFNLNSDIFHPFYDNELEILTKYFTENDPTLEVLEIKNKMFLFKENFYVNFYKINTSNENIVNSKAYNYLNGIKKIAKGNIIVNDELIYMIFNKGIYTYNIETAEWKPFLNLPKATSILIDQEKNVWISTMGDGIIKYSNLDLKSGKTTIKKLSDEPIKFVNGFKNQTLYIANSKNEIKEILKNTVSYKPELIDIRFLESNEIGEVYFGGSSAVYRNDYVFSKFGFKSMSLYQDSLAITSTFGTNFLNRGKLKSLRNFDNGQRIDLSGRMYAILLLKGKFYSGNQQGLFWGRPTINELNPICLDESSESVSVNGIKQSNDGLIWVATEGNGVYVLENDVVIRHFDNELMDANIHSIKTDEKNRVWVATRKGVNLIQKVGKDFKISAFNSFHGFPDDYINDIYCYDDELYVATDEGLVQVNINQLNKTNFQLPPPIHINSFKILKSTWELADKDTFHMLEYNENTVNFEYSGISYKSNGKVRYEYRLLPSVPEWLQTHNDNLTFNNLKPEKYTFEVRAIDAIGNVSKMPAQVNFEVKKHYSEKLWFRMVTLLTAFLILLYFILQYLKQRREQAAEQSRIEKLISELRLKSLQSQLNPHFIFNSLNAIQQFINTENKKSANDYLAKFARLMRLYLNGSDSQFITLKQELDVLKLYCSLEHLRFADKFDYDINIDTAIRLEDYDVPAMLLQPHVENAIRHGLIPNQKAKNFLQINIKKDINNVVCEIIDNGIGRSRSLELKGKSNTDHRSMGNKISKERLEMIRALKLAYISEKISDLSDEYGQSAGTKVEILIFKRSSKK
ncbi:MAG: histidine kinase [Saprospiraceae bacterium]|nr:histidine kinase [Saprospiraceae bacterium]